MEAFITTPVNNSPGSCQIKLGEKNKEAVQHVRDSRESDEKRKKESTEGNKTAQHMKMRELGGASGVLACPVAGSPQVLISVKQLKVH